MPRRPVHPPISHPIHQVESHLRSLRGWTGVADALASGDLRTHLAILVEPYLGLVLRGEKTVESRFAKVRCAPCGCVSREDLVLLKRSGGPVVGAFLVGSVWTYGLDPTAWREIRGSHLPPGR